MYSAAFSSKLFRTGVDIGVDGPIAVKPNLNLHTYNSQALICGIVKPTRGLMESVQESRQLTFYVISTKE